MQTPFHRLTRLERWLLAISLTVIFISGFLTPGHNFLSILVSLLGGLSIIFIAKGEIFGQFACLVFSILYGLLSYRCAYYGEVLIVFGLQLPAAFLGLYSWLKNRYTVSEVKVAEVSRRAIFLIPVISSVITVASYFLLARLHTEALLNSTLSVATSVTANMLLYLRSPYYAIVFILNDLVLIALWGTLSLKSPEYIPSVACFSVFLMIDSYGFYNWRRMQKRQWEAQQKASHND